MQHGLGTAHGTRGHTAHGTRGHATLPSGCSGGLSPVMGSGHWSGPQLIPIKGSGSPCGSPQGCSGAPGFLRDPAAGEWLHRLQGSSEYYGPTSVQEERRAGGPTRE